MQYNNYFRMQDFFCNEQLDGIVPQFNTRSMSDEDIYSQCMKIICGFLGGTITGKDTISVSNKSSSNVVRIVTACKSVLEAMFDNVDSILQNVHSNQRVYTTVETFSQIVDFDTPEKKLKFLNELLDNINYNPEFKSLNSVKSYSPLPFQMRQKAWEKKVGYKNKEPL